MASNGIAARRSFHRIWIAGKKSLVKRAPGAWVTRYTPSFINNPVPKAVVV